MADDPGRSMRDRMLAGEPYIADDADLIAAFERAQGLTEAYNATPFGERAARDRLLARLLGSYGNGCEVRAPFHCDYGTQLHLGDRVFVNFGLVALDVAHIDIGDDTQIGPYAQLLTAEHPLAAEPRRAKWESARPIVIEDNVWLGGGVIVCPGVRIGRDTVVGAGSVVTKDLPPGVVAIGSPARVVRELPAD